MLIWCELWRRGKTKRRVDDCTLKRSYFQDHAFSKPPCKWAVTNQFRCVVKIERGISHHTACPSIKCRAKKNVWTNWAKATIQVRMRSLSKNTSCMVNGVIMSILGGRKTSNKHESSSVSLKLISGVRVVDIPNVCPNNETGSVKAASLVWARCEARAGLWK